MNIKRLCSWLLLGSFWLLTGTVLAARPVGSEGLFVGWFADTDADGVDDSRDLCPGTPAGTLVNTYGCPLSLSTCDYTTAAVTLKSSGGSSSPTANTRYILTDNQGTILQVTATPNFSGLTGSATYMALALVYEGPVSNLSAGNSLSAVSASCFNWSTALPIRVCVASCDYQIGDYISLKSTGGSTGAGIRTSYVLTNDAGKLVAISAMPTFTTGGLATGLYNAYALTYTDDNSISKLAVNNFINQVTANCLSFSAALPLKLCEPCTQVCLPIQISRVR